MVLYDAEIQSSAAGQVPTNQFNDLFVLIRRTRIYSGDGVSGFVGRGPLGSLDRHATTPIRMSYSTPNSVKTVCFFTRKGRSKPRNTAPWIAYIYRGLFLSLVVPCQRPICRHRGVLVGRKPKPCRNAIWTPELASVVMEGIEDNHHGCALAQDRLKLLHPLPPGRKRYQTEFERWLKKVFEGRPVAGERVWLTAAFWQNEVDRALTEAIFGNVSKDEVIARIYSAWPTLCSLWLTERLEEVALTGLPYWMDREFWPNEVDPILLVGIRNSNQCEGEAVEAAQRKWPEWQAAAILDRLRRLRRQRDEGTQTIARPPTSTTFEPASSLNPHSTIDQHFPPDPILLEGIRQGRREERKSVNKVLSKFPELRLGSIWTRIRRLRAQQRQEAHIGVQFEWTTDLDERLRRTYAEAGLRAAVTELQCVTGWPRNAISRRARKLGLPHQSVGLRRRWRMSEFRFALESVSHMSASEIAEAIGRSEKAVREMIGQRGIEGRFQEGLSLRELGEILHVRRTTVRNWIRSGLLRRKKNGRIGEESLQSFLVSHPENIRWTSLDKHTMSWVAQLIQEGARVKEQQPGAKHQSTEEEKGAQRPTFVGNASNRHEVGPSEDRGSHDSQGRAANPAP
jgi:hypothetical protein